jgi:uncharacterized protein (TIGR00251 family)
MIDLAPHAEGTVLAVHAQPGARRNGVIGERAGTLRVAVSAPPDRGRANAALREVLAAALSCKESQVELIAGETSRQKRFLIHTLDPDTVRSRIDAILVHRESS